MPHRTNKVQVQSFLAEHGTSRENSQSSPSTLEQTPKTGVILKASLALPSWDAAVWTLCQELQQARRENQKLDEHVEDLTKRMSVMESSLAGLEQAPDVPGCPTGTLLIPKVEAIEIPLAEMDETRPMDCEGTETNLPAGHPEAVETGEAPSTPEVQSLPHNPGAAASIPDGSLLCISPQEDRRLFEEAEGDIAKYTLAVFRHTMPQDYYQQWRGKASVSGTQQKAALSPNLVNAAFKAAKRRKPKLAGKDYSNIKIHINKLMQSRKSRSLVISTGLM